MREILGTNFVAEKLIRITFLWNLWKGLAITTLPEFKLTSKHVLQFLPKYFSSWFLFRESQWPSKQQSVDESLLIEL